MSKKLSTRVRAGSEAAPWVVEAIRALERDRDIWQAKHGEAEQMTLSYVKRLHEMQAERDEARAALATESEAHACTIRQLESELDRLEADLVTSNAAGRNVTRNLELMTQERDTWMQTYSTGAPAWKTALEAEVEKWKKEAISRACAEEELHTAQVTIKRVKAERDAARAAIRERPEWQPNGDCEVGWDPGPVCGWCHRFTFQGHRDDCARQAGLGIGGRR